MSRDHEEEVLAVVQLWEERFGEPPPILTDPELMWRVLGASPSELREKRSWLG